MLDALLGCSRDDLCKRRRHSPFVRDKGGDLDFLLYDSFAANIYFHAPFGAEKQCPSVESGSCYVQP